MKKVLISPGLSAFLGGFLGHHWLFSWALFPAVCPRSFFEKKIRISFVGVRGFRRIIKARPVEIFKNDFHFILFFLF